MPDNNKERIDSTEPLKIAPYVGKSITLNDNKYISSKFGSTDFGESKFDDPNLNSEFIENNSFQYARGNKQGTLDKWANGLVKAAGVAGTSILENTAGFVYGIAQAATEKDINKLFNNDFTNTLDEFNKYVTNNMPNYKTKAEEDYSFTQKLGTGNFWSDQFLHGAAFMGAAIATGWGLNKYASLAKLVRSGVAVDEARLATEGSKYLDELAKTIKIADAVDFGKNAILISHGESAIEARDIYNSTKQNLIDNYKVKTGIDPDKQALDYIEETAKAASNWGYATNLAITGTTNALLFPKILSQGYSANKLKLNKIDLTDGKYIAQTENLKKGISKEILKGSLKEGGQELLQLLTQKTLVDYYGRGFKDKKDQHDFVESLVQGLGETLGTQEGLENFFLGAIMGGPASGIQAKGSITQKNARTQQMVALLNNQDIKKTVNSFDNFVRATSYEADKNEALSKGSKFDYLTAEFNQNKAVIKQFINSNAKDILIDQYKAMRNMPESEFKKVAGYPEEVALPKTQFEIIENAIKFVEELDKTNNSIQELFPYVQKTHKNPANYNILAENLWHYSTSIENMDKRTKELHNDIQKIALNKFIPIEGNGTIENPFKVIGNPLVEQQVKQINEDLEVAKIYKDKLIEAYKLLSDPKTQEKVLSDIIDNAEKENEESVEDIKDDNKKTIPNKEENPYKNVGRYKSELDTRTVEDLTKEYKVENNTINQKLALNNIINSSFSTNSEKNLAKELLKVTKDNDIIINKELGTPGNFTKSKNERNVNIDLRFHGNDYKDSVSIETTILHELLHKYTIDEYDKDKEFKNKIDNLYNFIKNKAKDKFEFYGLKNEQELITEGLTNPNFQKYLSKIKYQNTIKSVWDEFLDSIINVLKKFGINITNTALEEIVGLVSTKVSNKKSEKQIITLDEEIIKDIIPPSIINELDQENVSTFLNDNTSDNTKGTEQDIIDTNPINNINFSERGINLRNSVVMMRLFFHRIIDGVFKFSRDTEGFIAVDNNSNLDIDELNRIKVDESVKLGLISLNPSQLELFESQKQESLKNSIVKEKDFDNEHIGIYSNDKLIGFVQQPHAPKSEFVPKMIDGRIQLVTLNKTESEELRKELIEYRKAVIVKLRNNEEVIEEIKEKGNGNLYTKLKTDGRIDAIRPVFNTARPKDKEEDALLFVYHNGEKLVLPISRLGDIKTTEIDEILAGYKNFGKTGQIFQLVKDLRGSYALVPVYSSLIDDLTIDNIIEVLNTFNDTSDPKDLVKALNDYIYSSDYREQANLFISKKNGIITLKISSKEYTLTDILTSPSTSDSFKETLKTNRQNIPIDKINNKSFQEDLDRRNTLVTNVLEFKGEYFVQPYLEYSHNTGKKEVVEPTPIEDLKLKTPQGNTTIDPLDDFNPNEPLNDPNALSRTKFNDLLDRKAVDKWLENNLPQLSIADSRETADILSELKANLVDAYGLYKDLNIYLFEGATDKTAYHEAFHGVFRNILDLNSKEAILTEAINRYDKPTQEELDTLKIGLKGKYTNKQLTYLYYEEKLADEFAEFTKSYNDKSFSKRIKDFFNKILKFFNMFTAPNKTKIDELFEKINTAGFKKESTKFDRNSHIEIFNKPFEVFNDEYAYSKNLDTIFGTQEKTVLTKKIGNQFLAYYQKAVNIAGDTRKLILYSEVKKNYDDYIEKIKKDIIDGKPHDEYSYKYARLVSYYFPQLSKEVEKYLSFRGINATGDLIERSEGITEDEIGDEEVVSLHSQTTKGLEEATSRAGLKSASNRMKMFLSSIPVLNKEGKEVKDTFGITQFYDFDKLYYYIETHITDLYTFDEQLEKLQELSKNQPQIKSVITKLTDKSDLINKEEFEALQNDFKTNFSKQQLVYTLVKFDTDSISGKVSYKIIDANRQSLALEIRSQWETNIKDPTRNTIAEVDNTSGSTNIFSTKRAKALLEQWKAINTKKELNSEIVNRILNKVGIELSPNVLKTLVDTNTFKSNVTDILNWYASDKPIDVQRAGRKALNKLVDYEVTQVLNSYTSSFNNVENKNIYTIQLPSWASKMLATFKSDKRSKFDALITNLKRDPLFKYSNLLQDLDNDEYRKDIFKMSYLDGLKDEKGDSKGSKFTSQTPKDYFSQQIALFQNTNINSQKKVASNIGKYIYITPSDKTMAMLFDSKIYNIVLEEDQRTIRKESEIVNKYYNVYLSEKARIAHNLKLKEEIINNKDFNKLKSLLEYYHVSGKNWDEFSSLIDKNELSDSDWSKVEKLINGQAFEINYFSKKFNELTTKDEVLVQIQIELKQEIDGIRSEMIEKGLIKEQDGLFIPISIDIKGNTAQEVDYNIKHLIASYATNSRLFNIEMSNLLNGDYALYKPNDLQKRTYQSQSMYTNGKWNRDKYNVIVKKDVYLPSESGLEDYKNVNVTDAQVYVIPEFYKEFLNANGRWSNEMQQAHDILEGNTKPREIKRELRTMLGGIKPFSTGSRFDEVLGIQRFEQIKCAIIPLYKGYTDINPLLKAKREEMEAKGIDMMTHESAFKAAIGYRNEITAQDDVILALETSNLGIQVDNPEHILDAENDSLRQLKMLLLGSIDPNKTYKDKLGQDIIDDIMDNESINIKEALRELDKHIDVKSNTNFTTFIQDMVTKRGATTNIQELLTIEDGDFTYPLDNGTLSTQIENMISSMFTNKVVKQPFDTGGSGVQASSLGLKFKNLEEQQDNLTKEAKLIQQELQWIKPDKDGISYAECVMPAWASEFFDSKGFLKDLNNIPEELRQLVMYRIPTEGLHSMLPVKVIRFLPETMGNFILLPYEVTKQFGADFDFDKMYFIGREFYSKDSVLTPYKATNNIEERYNQYKLYNTDKKLEILDFEEFKELPKNQQIVRAVRNNKIIDNYLHLLTSIENYNLIITPSGFEEIKEIKDTYFPDYGKYTFFSSRTQRDYKERNHTGLALKGQSALHVSGHSYAVLMPLSTESYSENDYLDRTQTINFNGLSSTFNKMLNSNNEEQSFNKLYSPDGTLIADKLSSIMAAILDDIKSPILNALGINKYTIDTLATIIRSGHSIDTAIKFVAQPGIKQLSKLLDTNYDNIKYPGQKRQNVDDIIKSYSKILSNILEGLDDNIKDNTIFQGLIDKSKDEISNITDTELNYFLDHFSKSKQLKAASEEDKAKYYAFQIRCLKAFDKYETIAKELVDMNKIFAINKEVGPNIENIIAKQELHDLIMREGRIFKGFDISLIPTLQANFDVQTSAMNFFEEYFPYSTEYYMNIKRALVKGQSNLDLSKVKVKDKMFMNSFIRTYMDHKFDKFSNINEEYDNLFIKLPNLLREITNPVFKDKVFGKKATYDKIRNNMFINELKVVRDDKNGTSNIILRGNRLDLEVKNNIIAALTHLYNNEDTKSLVIDLVKHSFVSSGFFTGLNSYSNLIPPQILQDLGYMDYRFNLIQDLNYDDYNKDEARIDLPNIIDQMIRNNSKPFTKVFDDDMFLEYNPKEALPKTISTSQQSIEGKGRTRDIILSPRNAEEVVLVKYIRIFDKALGRTVIYKNRDNTFIYDRLSALGKKGYFIEVNPNEEIKESYLSMNNFKEKSKEENTNSNDEVTEEIIKDTNESISEQDNPKEENPFGETKLLDSEDLNQNNTNKLPPIEPCE